MARLRNRNSREARRPLQRPSTDRDDYTRRPSHDYGDGDGADDSGLGPDATWHGFDGPTDSEPSEDSGLRVTDAPR